MMLQLDCGEDEIGSLHMLAEDVQHLWLSCCLMIEGGCYGYSYPCLQPFVSVHQPIEAILHLVVDDAAVAIGHSSSSYHDDFYYDSSPKYQP
jgi:hypothetical protein